MAFISEQLSILDNGNFLLNMLKHDGTDGTVKMASVLTYLLPQKIYCNILQTVILKLRLIITYTYFHHYYCTITALAYNDNINSLKQIYS